MSEPPTKKSRTDDDDKDATIASLKEQLSGLTSKLGSVYDHSTTYYASSLSQLKEGDFRKMMHTGMPATHAKEKIVQAEQLDFKPRLNTSSYVNCVSEPEEREVALLGLETNLADASVYPASVKIHDSVVNMLAQLWHAPEPTGGGDYCGSGTVGSTEACLLAGLAHKFRWRKWYAAKNGLSAQEVVGILPNIVISTCFQAAWEKFFRYFDVEPKFVKPDMLNSFSAVNPKDLEGAIDEKTIAVVAILGNHYNGVYDPVWDMDKEVRRINEEKGFQVGIHIDGASGAFIAPFQEQAGVGPPPFDFRLPSVLSISSSGHKFGESICGTGWVVFRQREDLAEHIAVSVSYLGGHCDSMTLNFSRPASGPYVQFYKFLRLGIEGYTSKVANQMAVAAYIRHALKNMKHPSGKPTFQILDGGDTCCLPVVGARLNPELDIKYDDIDLQHALSESHWYVSGYTLSFENFGNKGIVESLFTDVDQNLTMFRIVCKSNLTFSLAEDLVEQIRDVLPVLDSMEDGYASIQATKEAAKGLACSKATSGDSAMVAALAASKWLSKIKKKDLRAGRAKHPRRGSVRTSC